jgi:hypothetical protein
VQVEESGFTFQFPSKEDKPQMGVQGPPSRPVVPSLQRQSVGSSLAAGALEFAGHVWHTSDVAPTVVEYSPSKQSVHEASPVTSLYFPATQSEHGPPSAPVAPALQRQSVGSSLAAGALEFAGHVWHTSGPADILYFPLTHNAQGPPSGPVVPGIHFPAAGLPARTYFDSRL